MVTTPVPPMPVTRMLQGLSSDGSCGMSCNYFDVSCKPLPNGGLQCVCETGPSKGKLFKIGGSCGSPNFENAVTNFCG